MTRPRVLLIDRSDDNCWDRDDHRFSGVAAELHFAEVTLARIRRPGEVNGSNVVLIDPPPETLVCGRGRALETAGLRDAYAIAHWSRDKSFDLVVAPLRGGLAFGLLMMRATGEHSSLGSVALWGDRPSRARLFDDEQSVGSLAPLVCDAMERTTLRLADALLSARRVGSEILPGIDRPIHVIEAQLPALPAAAQSSQAGNELIFVGPLTRSNDAPLFLDAIEMLSQSGRLPGSRVTLLSPDNHPSSLVGQDLIGIRAMTWPFRFTVHHPDGNTDALKHLMKHGHLAVFSGREEDDRLRRAAAAAGCRLVNVDALRMKHAGKLSAATFAEEIRHAWGKDPGTAPDQHLASWPELVGKLSGLRPLSVQTSPASVSVCMVSRGQQHLVDRALASIDDPGAEIVIVDNCGAAAIQSRPGNSGRQVPRIVRLDQAMPAPAAYNLAAAEASGDVLVLLDDDNTFAANGLRRLSGAVARGEFDIVVTTLDLVDGDPATDPSSGHTIFLGNPEMAGLFFNGFGDTAMAIRRDAFLAIGGFVDEGYKLPAFDWILLARARAAGLRIGVLIEPAVRYARVLGGKANNWMKSDIEGARRAVHAAYGNAIDGPLLARLAQGMLADIE